MKTLFHDDDRIQKIIDEKKAFFHSPYSVPKYFTMRSTNRVVYFEKGHLLEHSTGSFLFEVIYLGEIPTSLKQPIKG